MTNQKSRKRTWVIALVSIAALAVFGTVVLIGLGVYVFVSNVDIEDATAETAALSFNDGEQVHAVARLYLDTLRSHRVHPQTGRQEHGHGARHAERPGHGASSGS